MTGHAAAAVSGPRFIDTAVAILSGDHDTSTRETAELIVEANKILHRAAKRVLDAKDRDEMERTLTEVMPDAWIAVHVVSMGIRLTRDEPLSPSSRNTLLTQLRQRGSNDDVIERVRLGLLAADDEAAILKYLPGGLDAHPEIQEEDARGRFLLMTIAIWAYSEETGPAPNIWQDLTFAFLDSASRAFGLASAVVCEDDPIWSSAVA